MQNKKIDLREITDWFWDVDGVLYNPKETGIDKIYLAKACAEVGLALGINKKPEELIGIIATEYAKDDTQFFKTMEKMFGIDDKMYFEEFWKACDETKITRDDELVKQMEAVEGNMHIITQGSYEWSNRVINQTGFDKAIDGYRVTATETYELPKSKNPQIFTNSMNIVGAKAKNSAMQEDSLTNLEMAKKAGMTTIYFNYGKPVEADYVDYQFKDLKEFLKYMEKLREKDRKIDKVRIGYIAPYNQDLVNKIATKHQLNQTIQLDTRRIRRMQDKRNRGD